VTVTATVLDVCGGFNYVMPGVIWSDIST